jgi:hypothetical protein
MHYLSLFTPSIPLPHHTVRSSMYIYNYKKLYLLARIYITAAEQAWRLRWQGEYDEAMRQRPRRHKEAADEPLFTEDAVRRHEGLYKAESSVLVQARTGKIGLRDLFQRHVPEVVTPLCSCSRTECETAEHLVLWCDNVSEQQRTWLQERAQPLYTSSDFAAALQCPKRAKLITRWILGTGRLQEYRLAVEIINDKRQKGGARPHRCGRGAAVQQDN